MNQIFIGIIIILGLGSYWLFQENITLKANNSLLEGAVATQKDTMDAMTANFETQSNALQNMSAEIARIEAEKQEH